MAQPNTLFLDTIAGFRMPYSLRENVFFVTTHGRAIFFDLNAGRYYVLSGRSAERFMRAFVQDEPSADDAGILKSLQEAGIVIEAKAAGKFATMHQVATPQNSIFDYRRTNISWRMIVGVAIEQLIAGWQLKTRPLIDLIGRRYQKPRFHRHTDEIGRISRIAAAYRLSRRLISCHDQCLRTSIAFASRLRREGIRASLVIGVQARPFAVHAWVQQNDYVLNDTIDNVIAYTPIYVA